MARPPRLTQFDRNALVRIDSEELGALRACLFRRYPDYEWATFARFGWRGTPEGLVLTLAALDLPDLGDLDESVGHVSIQEQYTLRMALAAESHSLAVGVLHSHPQNAFPAPSPVDDDMDTYYATYFASFAPGRPYVSLIVSDVHGVLTLSGRVWWKERWFGLRGVACPVPETRVWPSHVDSALGTERRQRLIDAFGAEAERRLRRSTVAVVGIGGTGSAAVEVLARAGVGHLILVDPDHLEASNLERVHGSEPEDARFHRHKVDVAKRHILSIDDTIRIDALVGSLPQDVVLDAVVRADAVLGCTDQQHSRLAVSDLARRYLVPALDCGVALEGSSGTVSGQVIQCVRFLPRDPCPLCRDMILPDRVAQELMSEDERAHRRMEADAARARGEDARGYWRAQPQLNTVGYLTTTAGALAAGYIIGWLTGRFDPPFSRLQMNLAAPYLDVTDADSEPREDCTCRRARGWADQGIADALITAPSHWAAVRRA